MNTWVADVDIGGAVSAVPEGFRLLTPGHFFVSATLAISVPAERRLIARAKLSMGEQKAIGNAYMRNLTGEPVVYAKAHVDDIFHFTGDDDAVIELAVAYGYSVGNSPLYILAEQSKFIIHAIG